LKPVFAREAMIEAPDDARRMPAMARMLALGGRKGAQVASSA
jgi:hypothetical protein